MVSVVHVVDDDEGFRKSVGRLLRACKYNVKEYESAQQFLQSPTPEPGCILLDVQMPRMTGLELQARLAADGSVISIVFMTGHGDIATSVSAMRGGAEDFLEKPARKVQLVNAIDRAFARSRQAEESKVRKDAKQALINKLSPREREVLSLVIAGKLNKQIAHELGTTERTIKAHRHNLMSKLNAGSLADLFAFAESAEPAPAKVAGNQDSLPHPAN